MEQRRILVADTGEEYRREFVQRVCQEPDILVVGQTGDGLELVRLVEQQKPDVVVMEMILTGIDGVEVLERLAALHLEQRPRILIVSSLAKGGMADLAASRGADHYITKPCRPATVCTRIRQLCSGGFADNPPELRQDLESTVTDILLEIGVPPQVSGYNYLRDAIILAVNDPEVMRAVTKLLYPAVAKRFHSTPNRVERSIRHAIEQAWKLGNPDAFQRYFGRSAGNSRGRPTNSAFIAMIADRLQLRLREN